jgi:flagellar capping protein FliD
MRWRIRLIPTTMAQTLFRPNGPPRISCEQTGHHGQEPVERDTSLSTQLTTFQTLLKDLNKSAPCRRRAAPCRKRASCRPPATARRANGQYSFFVQQLAQAHQLSMTFSSETDPMTTEGKPSP